MHLHLQAFTMTTMTIVGPRAGDNNRYSSSSIYALRNDNGDNKVESICVHFGTQHYPRSIATQCSLVVKVRWRHALMLLGGVHYSASA